ncbi:MAG TPA: SHOCT domain-containing protein [Marmoricola sp.]
MGLWDVLVATFWFMLLVAWFWLLIVVLTDVFRDRDLSGGAKAAWCIFMVVIPWLGVLTYLLVRGRSMGERAEREHARNEQAFKSYVREAAGTGTTSVAHELGQLTAMRDSGQITPQEYEQAKQRVLSGSAAVTPSPNQPSPNQPSSGMHV